MIDCIHAHHIKDVKAQEGDKILLLNGQIVDNGKSQSL